jgi:hypothetical protein
MSDQTRSSQRTDQDQQESAQTEFGAPSGARQNVRSDTQVGAPARPGGATQNSGGALANNDDELGQGPGRGAD